MKFLSLLMYLSIIYSVEVTFNLDMTQEVISEEGVFLAGGGTFGAPGDNPMTDEDGDGIYTITVTMQENSGSDYTFSNGICNATTFSCKENIVGQDCAVPPWNDRHIDVDTEDVIVNACFGLCGDGSCDQIDPLETVDVSFNLDMSGVETASTGVYVAGGGFFGVPGDYPMSDDDGDDIWNITVAVPINSSFDYTFANGACSDFGCKENLINQQCAVPPYNDRNIIVGTENVIVDACFGLCGDGYCSELEPLETADVTFRVNMSAIQTNPEGVYLAGGDMGQEGYLMDDSDGDDIWEVTVALTNGRYLYKFRNQPSYGTWDGFEPIEGLIEGGCSTGDYADRYVDVENIDITLDVVDYGSCYTDPCVDVFCWPGQVCEEGECVPDPCNDVSCDEGEVCEDGNCMEVLPTVTLNVDMNCTSIEFFNVYLNGPVVSGWCGDCMPLSDIDGDGVWSITFESQPGELEYIYTLDGWAHQEDLVDDMVNGASCAPQTDFSGFANRVIAVTDSGAVSNDTYGSCDECVGGPMGPVNVTFRVDMQYQDPSNGVYLRGGTVGPMADPSIPSMGFLMSDEDGDLIYDYTVELDPNTYHRWKFATGESFNWEGNWENIVGDCIDEANYGDRFFTTGVSDTTLNVVCFSSCGPCQEDLEYTNVTFRVNMAGVDVSNDGVFLHGNWFNWGDIEMFDSDGDCVYETTIEIVSGTNGEYLFKNGTQNEQISTDCENINNWGGGVNRLITVSESDLILDPICFSQCESSICDGDCDILANNDFINIPDSFELSEPYPNPFNPLVRFNYSINKKTDVKLNIYDINGNLVENLINDNHDVGFYDISWNATNYPSGLYFVKLNSKSSTLTRKIMLIK